MRLRRSIRSRRYWTTYGSFAFVLGVTWTVIAAAQKTAELRWVHWILAAVWFGIAVGSFVRASRQAVDPQSAPPPSELQSPTPAALRVHVNAIICRRSRSAERDQLPR